MILEELYKIIEDRKKNMPDKSYVSSLFRKGNDRIIQKVGEEATEVVIAAKNKDKERIISEVADLLFHILVALSAFNISLNEVLTELEKRNRTKLKSEHK
jgi:phosphoribosyl-ATP pyrophosphohydrolase